jgi:hypothetical protein
MLRDRSDQKLKKNASQLSLAGAESGTPGERALSHTPGEEVLSLIR